MTEAKLTPPQTRAAEAFFVRQCSLASLQPRLPLAWPVSPQTPNAAKKSYRSHYVYPFQAEVGDPAQVLAWKDLPDFDLLLRLVDFSDLRLVLARLLGWKSGRGWRPFDPLSLFLLVTWQIANRWKRSQALRNLADPRYADYARFFGFQNGIYPSEGGVRHFLTSLGQNSDTGGEPVAVQQGEGMVQVLVQELNMLLVGAVGVLRQAQVLSEQAWMNALLCPDGQLHDAASQSHCISISESCYQPCTPDQPRVCPAKEKGRRGCECNSLACARVCRHATPRDRQARYVWYSGSNQSAEHPNRSTQDEDTGQARNRLYRADEIIRVLESAGM